MTTEFDLDLGAGRRLRVYDTGAGELTVFWHHGTPNLGTPPEPLFSPGIRWVSFDRPGYGGSTAAPGRDVASAAALTLRVADELGIERFAVMGHSGGGPHALACGALLPERVAGVVSVAGPAPYGAQGLDWFAGMYPSGAQGLRAAALGRAAKERFEENAEYDPEMFTPADHETLEGPWAWFGTVVGPALATGPDPLIDDDLAYVSPWGFDPALVKVPVLLLHGDEDRVIPCSHSQWLAVRLPQAELRIGRGDGHISILRSAPAALSWLRSR